jgi:hypothetical protein
MGQVAAETDSVLFQIIAAVNKRIWTAGEDVAKAALTPSTFEPCGCSAPGFPFFYKERTREEMVCGDPSSNKVEPTQPSKVNQLTLLGNSPILPLVTWCRSWPGAVL